jgi:hypothetical protein
MSKIANLVLNEKTKKWEAIFNGEVIVRSPDRKYVVNVITKGLNMKARTLGITDVQELGAATAELPAHEEPKVTFGVNERFQFLEDYVDMVANFQRKSVIVTGEGGLGKSHTVMRQLKLNGMRDFSELPVGTITSDKNYYVVVKGYSTPKGLFRTLYENRTKLIVFDDCDSILRNDDAANLLKAALDSYDRRIVTWNAESFGESDLPRSFEFEGAVIFISNMAMRKIPQAVITRAACADVSMTRAEIVTRMREIIKDSEFLPEFPMSVKTEALDFIGKNINNPQIKTINLRSLIGVATNRMYKPERWERLSLNELFAAC